MVYLQLDLSSEEVCKGNSLPVFVTGLLVLQHEETDLPSETNLASS